MVEPKFLLTFDDDTVQNSVSYILVSEFNIAPSILQAKITENGGMMIMVMKGNESDIRAAVMRLRKAGVKIRKLSNQISRNIKKCIDCGSCVSICPTNALYFNKDTWAVELDPKLCIACGSCLTSCPTHAVKLKLP